MTFWERFVTGYDLQPAPSKDGTEHVLPSPELVAACELVAALLQPNPDATGVDPRGTTPGSRRRRSTCEA